MIHGIINVYKEKGFTSHDVVAKLRGIVGQKKIGHTGTLDPDATGVLPVCLGKATKLCDLLTDKDKTYEAIIKGDNIPEPGIPESFKVLLKELQSIGLDVKILNEDQEEVVMKELEDEDEVVETGIEEVMEGSAVETDEVTVVEPEVEEEEELPADNGGEDDILSQLAYPMGDSSNDED